MPLSLFMLLDGLNDKQKEAVLSTKGPLLILAGAGSGKTRVLTSRVAHLLQEKNVRPVNILAVTFTNKAAQEMKDRVKRFIGLEGSQKDWKFLPYMGTFHSICARILRKEIPVLGFKSNFTIYDEVDKRAAVKQAMKLEGLSIKDWNPRSMGGTISKAKNQLITPEKYEENADDYYTENTSKVYKSYEKYLKGNDALDFDDLIGRMIEVFEKDERILKSYQDLFKYILVDEYQDTNHAQYKLVYMLAKAHENICVVGDDAQSIYRFRMADIQNILNFEKDFKDTNVVYLDQGYRNTKNILNAANEVIKHNKKQKEKDLWTNNQVGEKVKVYLAEDEIDEGRFVVDVIKDGIGKTGGSYSSNFVSKETRNKKQETKNAQFIPSNSGHNSSDTDHTSSKPKTPNSQLEEVRYSDFTVLYRTNAQSRAIEDAMLNAGVPYKIVGGVRYYERKEVKDVLAYLSLINNANDLVRLERAINIPPRGIGPRTVQKIADLMRETRMDFVELVESGTYDQEIGRRGKEVGEFSRLITDARKNLETEKLSDVLDFVLTRSGYRDFLSKSPEDAERLENIKELFTVIKKFDTQKGMEALNAFLEEVTLIQAQDDIEGNNDVVNLMTVHAAKGLEFKNVFIVGMEEGLFPHAQSTFEEAELEEERRLCYVAITRAIDRVYMIHAEARKLYGNVQVNLPSRFIEEVPDELKDVESYMDRVDSGKGNNEGLNDDEMIYIDFDADNLDDNEKKKSEFFPGF